jgi:hypothetical protein
MDKKFVKVPLGEATVKILAAGWIPVTATDKTLVFKTKPLNHVLHLILTLVTAGLWAVVWLFLVLTHHPQTLVVEVEDGQALLPE